MGDLMKRAVDPEPDPEAVLHQFEVHIAGPVDGRPGDHAVDERGGRSLGHFVVQVELGPRNIDDHGPGVVALGAREPIAVVLVEPSLDLGLQRDQLPFEENLAEGPCGGEATKTSRRCGRRLGRCGAGVSVRWLRVGGGRGR